MANLWRYQLPRPPGIMGVRGERRVIDLQAALVDFTGINATNQILMYRVAPLDPQRTLGYYHLPVDGDGKDDEQVFLYNKQHLRAGSTIPEPEILPPVTIEVDQTVFPPYPHPLDDASPLQRALPSCARDFCQHEAEAMGLVRATQRRNDIAFHLLMEVEVQGLAAEAARRNVNTHYHHINGVYDKHMPVTRQRHQSHQEILRRFQDGLAELASIELVPEIVSATGFRNLAQLLPIQRVQEHYLQCETLSRAVSEKLGRQEEVYESIKADVEALLAHAAGPNLDQLEAQFRALQEMKKGQEDAAMQISANFLHCTELLEEASRGTLDGPALLEACQVMEAKHMLHLAELLPRVRECDAQFSAFCVQCLEAKNDMTRELMGQLQRISMQQSRIKSVKTAVPLLHDLLRKQEAYMDQLLITQNLINAYKKCLFECQRRSAFADVYAGRGNSAADALARLRDKEVAKREEFHNAVQDLIPPAVLNALGLDSSPPLYQINLPTPPPPLLAVVSEATIRRIPAIDLLGMSRLGLSTLALAGTSPGAPPLLEASLLAVSRSTSAFPEAAEGGSVPLELENANLRAELATLRAAECVKASLLQAPSTASSMMSTVGFQPGGSPRSPALRAQDPLMEASSRYSDSLAAKESVIVLLNRQYAAARKQISAYEERIRILERRMEEAQSRPQAPLRKFASAGPSGVPGPSQAKAAAAASSGAVPSPDLLSVAPPSDRKLETAALPVASPNTEAAAASAGTAPRRDPPRVALPTDRKDKSAVRTFASPQGKSGGAASGAVSGIEPLSVTQPDDSKVDTAIPPFPSPQSEARADSSGAVLGVDPPIVALPADSKVDGGGPIVASPEAGTATGAPPPGSASEGAEPRGDISETPAANPTVDRPPAQPAPESAGGGSDGALVQGSASSGALSSAREPARLVGSLTEAVPNAAHRSDRAPDGLPETESAPTEPAPPSNATPPEGAAESGAVSEPAPPSNATPPEGAAESGVVSEPAPPSYATPPEGAAESGAVSEPDPPSNATLPEGAAESGAVSEPAPPSDTASPSGALGSASQPGEVPGTEQPPGEFQSLADAAGEGADSGAAMDPTEAVGNSEGLVDAVASLQEWSLARES